MVKRLAGFVPLVAVTVLAVAAAVVGVVESPSTPRASPEAASTSTLPASATTTIPSPLSTTLPPTPSQPATPTTATPSLAESPLTTCTFSDLGVSLSPFGTGAGHWGRRVSFRNVGTTTCTLYGYPGVALLNTAGQEVAQAERTPQGFIAGLRTGSSSPPTAILAPGRTATAVIEGNDVVGVTGTTSCPKYSGVLVTPPTSTEPVHFTLSVVACLGVAVHPVLATTPSTTPPGSTIGRPTVTQLTVVGMTLSGAAALTLGTGRHLEIQLMRERVDASVVPETIISQSGVSGSGEPTPPPRVLVDVTVAVPPAPPCRATQVSVTFLGGQGFTGNDSGFLVVRDTSPQWCSLTGPVEVWGQAVTGRVDTETLTEPVPVPIVMSPSTVAPQPFIPLTSPPVVQASVEFAANENGCLYPTGRTRTERIVPADLDLSIPGGITFRAPNQSYTKGFSQFIACYGRFLTPLVLTAVTVRG